MNAATMRVLERLANYMASALPADGSKQYDKYLTRHNRKRKNWTISGNSVTLSDVKRFMSCQDDVFHRTQSEYTHSFLGKDRDWIEIVYSTNNKDNESACCARCFIEKLDDGSHIYWAYMFTTNDPLAADNFNRMRGAKQTAKAMNMCVEQAVFCEDKVKQAGAIMTTAEIFVEVMNSRFVKSDFIRAVLGDADTGGVQKAAPIDTDLEKTDKKTAKSEAETRSALELQQLRRVVREKGPVYFDTKYRQWMQSKIEQRTDLHPFKAYKSVGRSVLLNKAGLDKWSESAFVCVLNARWKALQNSEVEQFLWTTTPVAIIECSKDDAIWALCLDGHKLDWGGSQEGRDFLFNALEGVLHDQHDWLEQLKDYCKMGTDTGDEAALEHLTTKTSSMRGKLGMTEMLVSELLSGNIIFSFGLVTLLKTQFALDKITIHDFTTPTLRTRDGVSDLDILVSIGG